MTADFAVLQHNLISKFIILIRYSECRWQASELSLTQKFNFKAEIKIQNFFFHLLNVQNTSAEFDFAVIQHDSI
jgi:hypothetical protein